MSVKLHIITHSFVKRILDLDNISPDIISGNQNSVEQQRK